MERNIGDIFRYDVVTLQVVNAESSFCFGCYFHDKGLECAYRKVRKTIGSCNILCRKDGMNVLFKKVEE